jgi:hypothetical protein
VPWRLDDLLLLALIADFAVAVRLILYNDISFARYLTAAVIFGVVLTGRLAARLTSRLSAEDGRSPMLRVLGFSGLAIVAALAAGFGFGLAQTAPVQPAVLTAQFLEAHHLSRGVGDYWSASILTVESGGAVEVRPIAQPFRGSPLLPYERGNTGWYGRSQKFNFLVYNTLYPFTGVTPANAEATFGQPERIYQLPNGYAVLVWSRPFTLVWNEAAQTATGPS